MKPKVQNFVHKHMNDVNRPSTHKDKKRDAKLGKVKHKGKDYE